MQLWNHFSVAVNKVFYDCSNSNDSVTTKCAEYAPLASICSSNSLHVNLVQTLHCKGINLLYNYTTS